MGKTFKVVVCGMKGVGKTSMLEQVIYGNVTAKTEMHPTIEDIYVANIESDKGAKEKLRFCDTAGIDYSQISTASGMTNQQLPRHYLALADGYILVYDTSKHDSLDVLCSIKKDIDKNKDKKEVVVIVIGNNFQKDTDNTVINHAAQFCSAEKLKHFMVSALQRSTLYEPFIYLTSKLTPPPSKGGFTPLSMGRKVIKDSI